MRWISVGLGVVMLGILLYLYGPDLHSRSQTKPELKEDPVEKQFLALAGRWSAVARWQHRIKSRGNAERVFTVDVERALLRTPGERFAFAGYIEDVARLSGDLYRVIVMPSREFGAAIVWLDLTCRGEIVSPIIESEKQVVTEYAVLASIKGVIRPSLHAVKVRAGEETQTEVEMPFELVASGECFEFVPLE